jgi:ATP-dependent exoDNAse (exonuclease V) alpha subunit
MNAERVNPPVFCRPIDRIQQVRFQWDVGAYRPANINRHQNFNDHLVRLNVGAHNIAELMRFWENNRDLGVKNGMLGPWTCGLLPPDGLSVEGKPAEEERLVVRLDSAQGPGLGRAVSISMDDYAAVGHGYATTIHKSQKATVDRHLTYVAMTRHRDEVRLYAGRDEFAGRQGGCFGGAWHRALRA